MIAGLYVYGIIDGKLDVAEELRGMGNESVFSVESNGISAVVSLSERRRFQVTEELLFTHERVVESLMSSHTVLPMRYGTVVSSQAEILEIVEKQREIIESLLQKVRGKVELGVKILWNPEPIKQQIESDDCAVEQLRIKIQQLQSPVHKASIGRCPVNPSVSKTNPKSTSRARESPDEDAQAEGRRYLMEKFYEELIQRKVKKYGEEFISRVLEKLSPFSFDKVFVKFPSERLLLSASFLVKKNKVADFEMLIQQLIAEYQQLSFLFTGPWPPYNFTKIQLDEP